MLSRSGCGGGGSSDSSPSSLCHGIANGCCASAPSGRSGCAGGGAANSWVLFVAVPDALSLSSKSCCRSVASKVTRGSGSVDGGALPAVCFVAGGALPASCCSTAAW